MVQDLLDTVEGDLHSTYTTVNYYLNEEGRTEVEKVALTKIIKEINLVLNQAVGHGVHVYTDDEGGINSAISQCRARYIYTTDVDDYWVIQGTSYQRILIEILGLLKDGEITHAQLYHRANWNVLTGDPTFDSFGLKYKVKDDVIEVVDKDQLARLIDGRYGYSDVMEYIDTVTSSHIVHDYLIECEGAKWQVSYQDRFTKAITTHHVKTLEEVIDTLLFNFLLEIKHID